MKHPLRAGTAQRPGDSLKELRRRSSRELIKVVVEFWGGVKHGASI